MNDLSYSRDFVRDLQDENQAMSRICGRWEQEYAALLVENQRLREALNEAEELLDSPYRGTDHPADNWFMRTEAWLAAREALAGDAE